MPGKEWGVGAALAVICAGWLYASPYLLVYQMHEAIKMKDPEWISDRVDLQTLRESLKTSLQAKLSRVMGRPEDNPFATLSVAARGKLVTSMVDALLTPEAISAMMVGEKPPTGRAPSLWPTVKTKRSDRPDVEMGYETPSVFVLKVRSKDPLQGEVGIVFSRSGLTWKLTSIRLPL